MRAPLLVPLLVLPLLLTACAEPGPGPGGAGPTPSATTSAAASSAAAPTATAGATPSAAPAPSGTVQQPADDAGSTATPVCSGPDLDIALAGTDSGAGSVDYAIALTNRARTSCHVSGAPRAVLIDAAGDPLGAEAQGTGQEGPVVRLAPGRSAVTTVRVVNVGEDGGPLAGRCTTRAAVAIAIDAPNYDRYEQVPVRTRGCVETDVVAATVSVLRAS